jgi:hypothetical protein
MTLSSGSPPVTCQISSAVKLRIGAISRVTALRDVPECALGRTPCERTCCGGVEPVLEDVEIEGRRGLRSRRSAALHDLVELEGS